MSVPKPPFHSVTEELLYNIFLKLPEIASLTQNDINTLSKLNALIADADLASTDDLASAINAIKGNVPQAGDTLEKLYNIIQGLNFLTREDIDTLAELNAILGDADVVRSEDLTTAINDLKGNAPATANTLEKLYNLLLPVLAAWVQGGNEIEDEEKTIGTRNNFDLPFITKNIERGRFDTYGNFLVGLSYGASGRLHIRPDDTSENNYSLYIDDPMFRTLFGVTNSGKLYLNKDADNLLINGGWQNLSGLRNLIITIGNDGARGIDSGNDNIVLGWNAIGTSLFNPIRNVTRSIAIGSQAGSGDNSGVNYSDSIYIGYRAGLVSGANRSIYIGNQAGSGAPQFGNDNTVIGYNALPARNNANVTLLGANTKAYNTAGVFNSNDTGIFYATAIGAEAVVRTPNTIVLGRAASDYVVIGAERNNQPLPGTIANFGFNGYRLQVIASATGLGLGISGAAFFRDGSFGINLGQEGNAAVKHSFRINSYVTGFGGCELLFSAANTNATIEVVDFQFGGTRNELLRLSPGGYANTAILIRPNDIYNTTYGYRYVLQGTNIGQQTRYVHAFQAEIDFPINDTYAASNRTYLYHAKATVKNHYIDGFFADVRGTDENTAFAFRSLGSRVFFDGTGMAFFQPVTRITTDNTSHNGATNLLLNGSFVASAALYINPAGSERTGIIISPSDSVANGLFIGPQQALASYNYDGYLMWLQYSTTGNNMLASTSKPMLFIRKHNAVLNGNDHTGAFLRMEENIGSSGPFIEAYKYDTPSNSLKMKFSIDKDGVVSFAQVGADPSALQGMGRLYFVGNELKVVLPNGDIKIIDVHS